MERFFVVVLLPILVVLTTPAAAGPQECRSHNGKKKLEFKRPNRPTRTFYVYTPDNQPVSGVVFAFHGWCLKGNYHTKRKINRNLADSYNYAIVGLDGLGSNEGKCNSWSFPGSTTGLGRFGNVTTCDNTKSEPNHCYRSCGRKACRANRCSWTQCQDDDIQMVRDFINGGRKFENALRNVLCFDKQTVVEFFVMGDSNGGMFTWSLLQDRRTAGYFTAAAPIIGLPHCDYDVGPPSEKTQVPVIAMTGRKDKTVSPSSHPWPGNPSERCILNRDGDSYYFVSSHRMTTVWAQAAGCNVAQDSFPTAIYDAGSNDLQCRTWCNTTSSYYASVDCAFDGGHVTPKFVSQAAFEFFARHSASCRRRRRCGGKRGGGVCCAGLACVNRRCQ